MKIEENISLKPYHSFGCEVVASYFTRITTAADIPYCIEWSKANNLPLLFIGGGSNLLFTKKVNALVAKVEISGIKKIAENATQVILSVGAGENWHHFVSYCVQKSWGGIENLSLSPGDRADVLAWRSRFQHRRVRRPIADSCRHRRKQRSSAKGYDESNS